MLSIFVTELVLKLDKSNVSNLLQPENILFIFVTELVIKLDGNFKSTKLVQSLNIYFIFATLLVSKFDISKDINEEHP